MKQFNEEGLYLNMEEVGACVWRGKPIVGSLVIAGVDRDGETMSAKASLETVRALVQFPETIVDQEARVMS